MDTDALQRDLRQLMNNTTSDGKRYIATYPSQTLTATGYRRTGTLKRSWSNRVRSRGNRIEGEVGSNQNVAPYNRFVQGGPREQARLFKRTSWRTVPDLEERMTDDFIAGVEDAIDRLVT